MNYKKRLRWQPFQTVDKGQNRAGVFKTYFVGSGDLTAPRAQHPIKNINIKNPENIEFSGFFALFVFCSGAVPLYSSHSQENEILPLSLKSVSVSP